MERRERERGKGYRMKEKRGAKRENRRRERKEERKTTELYSQVWFDQISK